MTLAAVRQVENSIRFRVARPRSAFKALHRLKAPLMREFKDPINEAVGVAFVARPIEYVQARI